MNMKVMLTYGDIAVDVGTAGTRHPRTKLRVAESAESWGKPRYHKRQHHAGTWSNQEIQSRYRYVLFLVLSTT